MYLPGLNSSIHFFQPYCCVFFAIVSIYVTQVQAYPPTKTAGKFIRFYLPPVSFEKSQAYTRIVGNIPGCK